MSNIYAKVRANVRSTKLEDCGSAVVVIGTTEQVVGSNIEPPDEKGSTTVEHDPGIQCCMVAFAANESAHVQMFDAQQAVLGKPSETAYTDLGDAVIIKESVTRKSADSKGGEVVERRLTIRIRCPKDKPINQQTLGYLLDRKVGGVVLGIGKKQLEIPMPAPVKRKPGRPKKDEQDSLDFEDASESAGAEVNLSDAPGESADVAVEVEAAEPAVVSSNPLEDAVVEAIKAAPDEGIRPAKLATAIRSAGFEVELSEVLAAVRGCSRINCDKPTITTLLTPSMVA
jgi:hypothetical protein